MSLVSGHHHCGGRMWLVEGSQVHEPATPLPCSLWLLVLLSCRCILGAATRLHYKLSGEGTRFSGTNAASAPLTFHWVIIWGCIPGLAGVIGLATVARKPCLHCFCPHPSQFCLPYMFQYNHFRYTNAWISQVF